MQSTIKKWGNSLAARIPKSIIDSVDLHLDQLIDIKADNGAIVITPVQERKEYKIDDLLKLCKAKDMQSLQEDEDWLNAEPVGKEIW